jgi:hypothetical protein
MAEAMRATLYFERPGLAEGLRAGFFLHA